MVETIDKLNRLVAACKGSVTVSFNDHRSNCESVEDYISFQQNQGHSVSEGIRASMVANNSIVSVQFYPESSIGSHFLISYALEDCLDKALSIVGNLPRKNVDHA